MTDPDCPDWFGVLDDSHLSPTLVADLHRVADAAKQGHWHAMFAALDTAAFPNANGWRPSGSSWFAPLHQVAWHGAPVTVADELVRRGAWRTLPDAKARRPLDVAREKGHHHLVDVLTPRVHRQCDPVTTQGLERQLAALVESRIRPQLDVGLRHPAITVLTELPTARLWFAVPGMYGGFAIELREHHLYVESWSRVDDDSLQAHVVTMGGFHLARHGWS